MAKVYPSDVKGPFRDRRTLVSAILFVIFLVLPWIKIRGEQALLLDIGHRRFSILGFSFWAHDAPLLLFVVGIVILAIALFTALFGRVWCGWACPQTVFIDLIYRRIERWIEGDAFVRKRLDVGNWNEVKIAKKSAKWFLYVIVSLILSHSFLAYFVGTQALSHMIASSPVNNPGSFMVMLGMFGLVLFDFGWFREKFCIYVCPYGRLQSVLLDEYSWVVAYDQQRGEPRRGVSDLSKGDCVACNRCVQVCPTGIDIRNGLQLECISCTACMDACDVVMSKVGKPAGLIRYASRASGALSSILRPRPLFYLSILAVLITGFGWVVHTRRPVETVMIRAVGAPYQTILRQDQKPVIVNHFHLDLQNQTMEPQSLYVEIDPELANQGVEIISANLPVRLTAGQFKRIDLFVQFGTHILSDGKASVTFRFISPSHVEEKEERLVGPFK